MNNSLPQYKTFATKYRPNNLRELFSQEVLVKILNYSIINNRLSPAYLLTGIRGIGKTTTARIIAKTINCSNPALEESLIIPCMSCPNCDAFNKNNHPDIIEFDAASKTSVDDIRVIIKSSEYRPLLGKYKTFIIDEVHMLSTSAFNALLKILEEPPAHVIFIFATTEVQKIPLTIISRCIRFDLRRFTQQEVFALITGVAVKENLQFEESALQMIAYKSEGSARDALSLLDQASILCMDNDQPITGREIEQLFGLISISSTIELLGLIIKRDANKSIQLINDIYFAGSNLELFINSLSSLIAYLSKAKLLDNYSEDFYQFNQKDIDCILASSSAETLSILWQIFTKGIEEIKNFDNQLILTEMLIFKAIYAQNISFAPNDMQQQVVSSPSIEKTEYVREPSVNIEYFNVPAKIIEHPPQSISDFYSLIIDFLKYLYNAKEVELYYFILNEVEILSFEKPNLKLAISSNIDNQYKTKLQVLLKHWDNNTWDVVFVRNIKIRCLRESLINIIKDGKEWQKIKQHFPSADISDILCLS